jgi:hypothetical protein
LAPVLASFRENRRPLTSASLLLLVLGLLWGLLGAPRVGAAEDPCLKLVFGRYCLGGDVNPLLQSTPQPLARETEGNSLALVFPEDVDQIYVLAFGGRIYKVVRSYRVATQLRFDEIYALLREKYGPGRTRADSLSRPPHPGVVWPLSDGERAERSTSGGQRTPGTSSWAGPASLACRWPISPMPSRRSARLRCLGGCRLSGRSGFSPTLALRTNAKVAVGMNPDLVCSVPRD